MSKQISSNKKNQMISADLRTSKKYFGSAEWFQWKLEEYSALRAEVLDAGKNAIIILRFGLLTITGLVYLGLVNWADEYVVKLIFLIFCPASCYLVMFIWVGEIVRRFRASHYIRLHIEDTLSSCFDVNDSRITWENWLRGRHADNGKKRLYQWHRASTILLFMLIAICSITAGMYRILNTVPSFYVTLIFIAEYSTFALASVIMVMLRGRISQW